MIKVGCTVFGDENKLVTRSFYENDQKFVAVLQQGFLVARRFWRGLNRTSLQI